MNEPKPSLKVAVAQIETVLGDVKANLRRHLELIAEARAAAVDALVFPELSLTGYGLAHRALDLAMQADDPVIGDVARAAGPMAVTVGYVEAADHGRPYNTAVTVCDGRVVSNHRKLNLPGYGRLEEPKWFSSGSAIEPFELAEGWCACTLVCADLWNPALVHIAASHGAMVLLAPISSAVEAVGEDFDNARGWQVVLDFYAMMYGLPILMANRAGREAGFTSWGGSRVLDPFGRTIAQATADEGMVVADIRLADIGKARRLLPTVRDSDPALLRAEFERLLAEPGVA
jgi:N-carbamoylputrescine amidase